ncbi:unnamed protein product [Peronospora farinosa]|uniref:Integrase catalytic domain-containing protein n=1 Tax=Peronospora farinosa TaxID=134698 RepID=A0AAV0UGM4_9STRA|nr:unnamed protein product [Peronospora farinosa]
MQAMKSCDGISRVVASDGGVCDGCARGKMTNSPFSHTSGSEVKTSRPLEVVHTDLMGPMNPKSKGGALYVLTFIDDYSRFVYVYLLAAKSQVFERFKAFRAMVEKQTDCKIKCIRSDNGGEYTNHRFNNYYEVKVEVPDLNKNNEDDEMDVDETADNDTSWEDMVVDASGDLNQSQNLDVVPIERERTDIQVIDTNNSMIRRTSHGSVAGSSNNGTHMLSGIPDQSRAIIVCENSRAPDDRMEIYSGSDKRPYSTFTSSRLLTNDDFDDERIDLPLLTDGSPVEGENDEPDPKRQCVDDYEISLSATDVPMNLREALQ